MRYSDLLLIYQVYRTDHQLIVGAAFYAELQLCITSLVIFIARLLYLVKWEVRLNITLMHLTINSFFQEIIFFINAVPKKFLDLTAFTRLVLNEGQTCKGEMPPNAVDADIYSTMKYFLLVFMVLSVAEAPAQKQSAAQQFDTIFTKPTVLASYPGGDSAWRVYVKKHLKYPRKAWWDELETDVVVRVVIEKDGTVSEARHLTNTGYGFEQEAVRLVLKSGRWIPATNRGKPVKSEGQLTIEFRLK